MGLCSHPRSFHRHPQPAALRGLSGLLIPPRLSSLDQEPTNGGTVFPSEVLPPASTPGRAARVILPRFLPPAPDAWKGICVLETPSTDKSDPSAIMSTDLCTSKSLKGFYGVRPTMKMLPTQPMFKISMEEMDMTVSEHYCCSGRGYGTDPKEATYLGTLPQYLGFAQDGQMHVYKEKAKKSLYGLYYHQG